jgi:hypothetical protein
MDQWNSTNRNLNLRPFITVKNIRHLTKKHLGFNQPREQTCGFRQIVFLKQTSMILPTQYAEFPNQKWGRTCDILTRQVVEPPILVV